MYAQNINIKTLALTCVNLKSFKHLQEQQKVHTFCMNKCNPINDVATAFLHMQLLTELQFEHS